jgi:hypothetical protein
MMAASMEQFAFFFKEKSDRVKDGMLLLDFALLYV